MEKLIEGCINNDGKSQTKLYDLFKGKMLKICHGYTSDTDTAEEIMQLGFIKVFNNIHKYNGKGSFEGWVVRIMKNMGIDHIRMVKRRQESIGYVGFVIKDKAFDVVDIVEEVEVHSDIDEVYQLTMDSLEELSPSAKKAFVMHVIEGKKHREIAEILGITEGSTKSNLAKAKGKLKKVVGKKMEEKDLHI